MGGRDELREAEMAFSETLRQKVRASRPNLEDLQDQRSYEEHREQEPGSESGEERGGQG